MHSLWPKVTEPGSGFWVSICLSLNRFIESHKSEFRHLDFFFWVDFMCLTEVFFFFWTFTFFLDCFLFALVYVVQLGCTESILRHYLNIDFLEVITDNVCVCEESRPRPHLHAPVCRRPIGSTPSDTPATHLSSAVLPERRHLSPARLSLWASCVGCSRPLFPMWPPPVVWMNLASGSFCVWNWGQILIIIVLFFLKSLDGHGPCHDMSRSVAAQHDTQVAITQ